MRYLFTFQAEIDLPKKKQSAIQVHKYEYSHGQSPLKSDSSSKQL